MNVLNPGVFPYKNYKLQPVPEIKGHFYKYQEYADKTTEELRRGQMGNSKK